MKAMIRLTENLIDPKTPTAAALEEAEKSLQLI